MLSGPRLEWRRGHGDGRVQEEIYNTAGHLIRRLNQISMSVFQNRVRAAGFDLTSVHFAALVLVRSHPGIDQAGLAGLIAYDRATIGGVVDRLEAKQLLDRRVSPQDRRVRERRRGRRRGGLRVRRFLLRPRCTRGGPLAATIRAGLLRWSGRRCAT